MKINLSKIITVSQFNEMEKSRYEKIKEMGKNESYLLYTNIIYETKDNNLISKRAAEIAFNTHKYKNLTIKEKEILKSEITYADIDMFCKLITRSFSFEELQCISVFLEKYKEIETNRRLLETYKKVESLISGNKEVVARSCEKYETCIYELEKMYSELGYSEQDVYDLIDSLTEKIKVLYGIQQFETYITRLNSILAFNPELLKNNQKKLIN